jgi:hypothetical protein
MTAEASVHKGSAVIVRYKLPLRRVEWAHRSLFLSYRQLFKFKTAIVLDPDFFDIAHVAPISGSARHKADFLVFVLHSFTHDQIRQVETLLDKPGRITHLLQEATTGLSRKVTENDLSVEIEDQEPFAEFSDDEPQEEAPASAMKFYEYTEKVHALLNEAVAGYTRLEMKETKKEKPDTDLLAEIDSNRALAINLLRKFKTFSSLERMSEIVDEYTPIVKALYQYSGPQPLAAS